MRGGPDGLDDAAFDRAPAVIPRTVTHPVTRAERKLIAAIAKARTAELVKKRAADDQSIAAQILANSPDWPA